MKTLIGCATFCLLSIASWADDKPSSIQEVADFFAVPKRLAARLLDQGRTPETVELPDGSWGRITVQSDAALQILSQLRRDEVSQKIKEWETAAEKLRSKAVNEGLANLELVTYSLYLKEEAPSDPSLEFRRWSFLKKEKALTEKQARAKLVDPERPSAEKAVASPPPPRTVIPKTEDRQDSSPSSSPFAATKSETRPSPSFGHGPQIATGFTGVAVGATVLAHYLRSKKNKKSKSVSICHDDLKAIGRRDNSLLEADIDDIFDPPSRSEEP